QAVNRFTNLADESKEVPNLCNKTYDDFKLDQSNWKHLGLVHQYALIADAIKQGLKNVDKYYKKTSDSDVYFICLILDPNYKLAYVEDQWD
ncbi:hypothetical protein BDR06DRAFT_850715, partial [Suillus hirtellus]